MKAMIFDIDGTLSDPTHRLHHVTNGNRNWDAFFGAMGEDGCYEDIVELLHGVVGKYNILLCSGRPDDYREATRWWLTAQGIVWDKLYMRPSGDYRPDHVVKLELLAQMRADGYDPFIVIDDRPSVVRAWREAGLTCLQCRDWVEDHTNDHAPPALLTLMVGPSGAGKSCYIDNEIEYDRLALTSVISSDQLRLELCGDFRDQSKNDQVFAALHALVKTRLDHGLPTVVDATNLKRRDRLANVALQRAGAPVRYLVLDRPMEEKLRDRGWRGEELIRRHDQTFRSQLKDILKGDELPNVEVVDLR